MTAGIRRQSSEFQRLRSFVMHLEEAEDARMRIAAEAIERSLTPKQREQVKLYYICQMPMKDIAQELGINPSTVSRSLKSAREKLNTCMALVAVGAGLRI